MTENERQDKKSSIIRMIGLCELLKGACIEAEYRIRKSPCDDEQLGDVLSQVHNIIISLEICEQMSP
jgi:hypothetical protein